MCLNIQGFRLTQILQSLYTPKPSILNSCKKWVVAIALIDTKLNSRPKSLIRHHMCVWFRLGGFPTGDATLDVSRKAFRMEQVIKRCQDAWVGFNPH